MEQQKGEYEETLTAEKLSKELDIPIEKVYKFFADKFLAARERCGYTRTDTPGERTKTITCSQSTCTGVCHVIRFYIKPNGDIGEEDFGVGPKTFHQARDETWSCECR